MVSCTHIIKLALGRTNQLLHFMIKIFFVFAWIYTFFSCETTPEYNFTQQGKASYYAHSLQGNRTASGEPFHADSLTAAHRHLPLGTEVIVKNLKNGKSVKVRINDRGPFVKGRIIDVSPSAADSLEFLQQGVASIEIQALLPAEMADSLNKLLNPQGR